MEQNELILVVCPYCGKVKQFGEFKHIVMEVFTFLCRLASKGINRIYLSYEVCPSCRQDYHFTTR